MFDAPTRKTVYAAPSEPIDINERYLVKLANIVDEGVSRFADPARGQTFHNLRWHFRVAYADTKAPILTTDLEPWEHVQWTTSKTGKNPTGVTATARLWIEALMGRTLEDDEISADLPDAIIGKVASVLFENKEYTDQEGNLATKLSILRMTPYRGEPAKSKPAPKPEPEATAAF